jgi:HD-GYP domain-containing protein (c-di-GMP phosphodiesterase class II)
MQIRQEKVFTADLKTGMFVSRLDRPWLETPYKLQGFLIKSEKDIDRLIQYCDFVYIDVEKSRVAVHTPKVSEKTLTDEEQKELLIDAKPRQYQVQTELKEELGSAYVQHEKLTNAVKDIVEQQARGNKIEMSSIKKSILPMVDSVIRNPDAFIWLSRIRSRDDYTYSHSISSSIWAAAFGRNLGLPVKDIQAVSIGGLLFDVGKVKLPVKLINNPNKYNPVEFNLIKKHVDYSLEIVKSIKGVSDDIVNMIATHHERHDGSGYPNALKGHEIPLFGKMAGIVDLYDAITSDRPHAEAISPHDAVKQLYELRGIDFQPEVVEQFIQVVGIYPVGTLVELSDGRVGVVVSHNKVSRLRPRIMLILKKDKEFYPKFRLINLYEEKEGLDGRPLNITKTIKAGYYGIDTSQLYL